MKDKIINIIKGMGTWYLAICMLIFLPFFYFAFIQSLLPFYILDYISLDWLDTFFESKIVQEYGIWVWVLMGVGVLYAICYDTVKRYF